MVVKIKDLPKNERPYERLVKLGANYLSNEELIAILLKSGTKNYSSKELASIILSKMDNISELKDLSYEQLKGIKGIGMSKACILLASIELGRRMEEPTNIQKQTFNSSNLVYQYYKNKIGRKKQEYFYCVYLDNRKKLIRDKLLFIGTVNYSVVHPREVFKEAYLLSASAIICVHNHPANYLFPSKEDIEITKRLKEVGLIVGIPIIDHVIVGKSNYYSFLENGDI